MGQYGLGIIAHLYNTSAALHGGVNQAVYNHKDRNPLVYKVGVLDIERGVQKARLPPSLADRHLRRRLVL